MKYSSYVRCVEILREAGARNASRVCYSLFEVYGEESVMALIGLVARRL